MNILIITTRIPYPPYRGDKLKVFNIAKQLSKKNSVKILTFNRNNRELKDVFDLQQLGFNVESIKLSYFESLINILKAFCSRLPFQVAWFTSSRMHNKILDLLKKEKFDIIYFHLIRTAQYISGIDSPNSMLKIIDYTDSVSLYLNRFYEIEKNPIKKYFIGLEKERVREYEVIADKFDNLFICSPVDKKNLEERGIKNINLLPNGIDTEYFVPTEVNYEPNRILFTGNLPYFPNIDAISFFVKDIFPLVLKNFVDAKFFIVGQKPPLNIRRLASEKIIITGFVKDIKAEYLKSAVTIAPMRFGAGTLNKILESIALGIPVVATGISVLGLPPELKKYVFTASDSEEFSEQILYVLKNPSIRKELMQEGKEKIKELLSWDKIVGDFEEYLLIKRNRVH